MQVSYEHKGYKLVWSDGGENFTNMGSEWIMDSAGNVLVHATTNGVPPNEKQAKATIEAILGAMGKMLDKAILEGVR